MQQLTEIQQLIDAQRDEIETLKDRLILAQSEALAAIQQNETKPEPRDIGHENVVSFVTRKSGELQVSPGIVWGLLMDLIAKNPDHFGTDADSCPDPVEYMTQEDWDIKCGHKTEHEYKVGDVVKVVKENKVLTCYNGMIDTILEIHKETPFPFFLKELKRGYDADELEFISRP